MIQLRELLLKHRVVVLVGCLAAVAALSALLWMEDLAIEDVSKTEIVTYAPGESHIAYQPTQASDPVPTTDTSLFLDCYFDLEGQPILDVDIKWQDDFSGRTFCLEDSVDYAPELVVYQHYYDSIAIEPEQTDLGVVFGIQSYVIHSLTTYTAQEMTGMDVQILEDLDVLTQTNHLTETAFVCANVTWTYTDGWEVVGPQLSPGTYDRGYLVGRTDQDSQWEIYETFWMEEGLTLLN